MIGIILLTLLCVKNANTARLRGRKAVGFVWMTIGLWIGAGIAGFLLGALFSDSLTSDIGVTLVTLGCMLLFEIGGGTGAYFITKHCGMGCAAPAAAQAPAPETVADTPSLESAGNDEPPVTTPQAACAEAKPSTPGLRGKRLWWLLGGSAAAIVLILTLVIGGVKKRNYASAVALFEGGRYAEAAAAFDGMGGYQDAPEQATLSRHWETYTSACELARASDPDRLGEAETLFLSLGVFEDSVNQAALCANRIDYHAAAELEQAERYEEALAAFTALGGFEDARKRARACADTLDYGAAMALMESGEYAAAAEELAAPAESGYQDAAEQLALCENKVAFGEAERLFTDGAFYAAFQAFTKLGTFEDAAQRAQGCVQELPNNGELYHNDAYKNQGTHLKVVNSSTSPTFLKLYAANGDLACSFFIHAKKSVTVKVPAGTYSLNQAYGNQWFGLEDLFGDDGDYYKCKIEDSHQFTMQSGYIYTISQGTGGTPVVNSGTERGTF